MRSYELGNPKLDEKIQELVAKASRNPGGDLIGEMITTALKLHRDNQPRGELRLINTALKEMRYSSLVFSRHSEPKVTIFGSARLQPDDPNYQLATQMGAAMAKRGWGVITGAGPGIMEAGNIGAGIESSYGINIRLPFEDQASPHIADERTVNHKYFFTRKLGFVKESHGFVIFPGGFGTLDEAFELFTLVQTGKSDIHPIVLIEAPGTEYWGPLTKFISEVLVPMGLISPSDLGLFRYTTDVETAAEEITGFYNNYQSQRYVDGQLILRLVQAPPAGILEVLSDEFSDLLVDGRITQIDPTEIEFQDGDALDLERVSLHFDRRRYGRLRLLIDRLNSVTPPPRMVAVPTPFPVREDAEEWLDQV